MRVLASSQQVSASAPPMVRLGGVGVLGAGLNFAALTALPVPRRDAVTTAANAAAATLGFTPQFVVDSVATLASLLPGDGCNLSASGGATTVQGDPVGAIRRWNGVELATQSNASLRPVSAAAGIFADGTKKMSLGNLSAWAEGEGVVVSQATNFSGFWKVGTGTSNATEELIPWTSDRVFINFGEANKRVQIDTAIANPGQKIFYNPRVAAGSRTVRINNLETVHSITIGFSDTAEMLFSVTQFYFGTWSAMALNSTLYTPAQRAAVTEFCRNYYGVTY